MLRAIDRRRHNEYAADAGLHGIKVPFRFNTPTGKAPSAEPATPQEQAAMENAMMKAQQRVRARYG